LDRENVILTTSALPWSSKHKIGESHKMKEATLDNGTDSLKLPNKVKMNNPGIDLAIWKRLRKRWTELEKAGHKLKIDFQLFADVDDENNILAIDVIQNIDSEVIIETVERNSGEADTMLGIAGLSAERLIEVYKGMMRRLHQQIKQEDMDLIVTMSPTSLTSGEVRGYLQKSNSDAGNSVPVNYQHYYILKALRGKMTQDVGVSSTVRAVYRSDNLEFYFEH
jgi:hypothetical protein